jgi:hypothetical protein
MREERFCHDPNPGSVTGNAGAVLEGHPARAKPQNGHIKRVIYYLVLIKFGF